MKNDQVVFYNRVYHLAFSTFHDPTISKWVAAMACIETGWGKDYPKESNNLFGIKPVGEQPNVTYKGSAIRVFESEEECLSSLRYLIMESIHYDEPRDRLFNHLEAIKAVYMDTKEAAYQMFFSEFTQIYCPENKEYFSTVAVIKRLCEDGINPDQAKKPSL